MRYKVVLMAALGLVATGASAQGVPTDSSYVSDGFKIEFKRTSPEIRKTLEESKQPERQPIKAPDFVVKSTDNRFVMAIGGYIAPVLGYDIGNDLYEQDGAGLDFVTNAIPVPPVKGRRSDFFINGVNFAVDFQIVGLAGTKNQITAYFKLGTNDNSSPIKLKRAYVSYRNFTVGEVATLMEDGDAAQPPTIDQQGPCGIVGTTAYEVAYKSPSYGGFRWALGLDMPSYYASDGRYQGRDYPRYRGEQVATVENVEQMMPDIPAWVEYSRGIGRIRATGMLRTFTYRDLLQDKVRHVMGYGVMLSGNLTPVKPLTFNFQAAYGQGIGAYLQDIAGMPLSFVPSDSKPGHMKASPMMGWVVGASYNFAPRWQFNVMTSQSRIWKVADYCTGAEAPANYKYALYAAANVFYNITSYLQCGMEYIWGRHVTWNKGGANDSRIQAQIKFTI